MAQQASIKTSSSSEYTSLARTGSAGWICYILSVIIRRRNYGERTHSLPVRLRGLSTAEVAQGPGRVPQHAQLAAVTEESQQRAESTGLEDEVAAGGTVTGDVAQSPDSLLPDIGLVAAEEFDEDGHSAGLDDDLCLLCGARGNVCEGPCGLELDQCVRGAQELDKAADDARLDNTLNGRVALLGEQLAELCGGLDLLVNLF